MGWITIKLWPDDWWPLGRCWDLAGGQSVSGDAPAGGGAARPGAPSNGSGQRRPKDPSRSVLALTGETSVPGTL